MLGLDLLRAAAILMVVFYHLPKPQNWILVRAATHFGWIGVDLFFVLSGYLIAGQLFASITKGRRTSPLIFYVRRFLRTLPNYYVVLGVTIAGLAFNKELNSTLHIARFFAFTQNFGVPPFFSISWSLCIEEQFYLVFPLLILAIRKWGSSAISILIVLIIVCGGVILRSWLWLHYAPNHVADSSDAWGIYLGRFYYPTYARLDGLTLGVGTAALRYFKPELWEKLMERANAVFFAGLALLLLTLAICLNRFGFAACVFAFPMLAASFALILIAATTPKAWIGRLAIPGIPFIALLSYAMYLTHLQAFSIAVRLASALGASVVVQTCLCLLTVLALACVLHFVVERPFLKLRDRVLVSPAR